MKKGFALAVVVCLGLGSVGCDVLGLGKANIVMDGALSPLMTSYGCPEFDGFVKNTGSVAGYNCEVTIICYSDSTKKTIIDSANGFPANLGDIEPGQRAFFTAVCFHLSSHAEIVAYDIQIDWLDRKK